MLQCVSMSQYYRAALDSSPKPEAGRLIWKDKSTELQMTAGHDTAKI